VQHNIDRALFVEHKIYKKLTNNLENIQNEKSSINDIGSLQIWSLKISYM